MRPPVNSDKPLSKFTFNEECICVGVLTVTPRDRNNSAIKIGENDGCEGEHWITKSSDSDGNLIVWKFDNVVVDT